MDKPPVIDEGAWAFPTIDLDDVPDCVNEVVVEEVKRVEKDENNPEVFSPAEEKKPEAEIKTVPYDEFVAIKEEYENKIMELKNDYRNKVESVNRLLDEIESPLSVFDNDMINLMQVMIKKIAKKLIYKEIEADTGIITHMIDELKKHLTSGDSAAATVYLSDSDFKMLNHKNKNKNLIIAMDENLDAGDIIVKSNFSEVQAILTERIDQILGNRHG